MKSRSYRSSGQTDSILRGMTGHSATTSRGLQQARRSTRGGLPASRTQPPSHLIRLIHQSAPQSPASARHTTVPGRPTGLAAAAVVYRKRVGRELHKSERREERRHERKRRSGIEWGLESTPTECDSLGIQRRCLMRVTTRQTGTSSNHFTCFADD